MKLKLSDLLLESLSWSDSVKYLFDFIDKNKIQNSAELIFNNIAEKYLKIYFGCDLLSDDVGVFYFTIIT